MKGVAVVLVLAAAIALCGCRGKSGAPPPDAGPDGGASACAEAGAAHKVNGTACNCDADCDSGFCVEGVCCSSACTETCKSCNVQGSVGTCALVPEGQPPPVAASCEAASAATCGQDGTCDGKGDCRKHPAGTVCRPGHCEGAAVNGVEVCDGRGSCRPGPSTVCAPFGCDASANACFATCRSDADCVSGTRCVNGSCGLKPRGAICSRDGECASGFCTDGVCCNVSCRGGCVTCNQAGRGGTCWPVARGNTDPHSVCRDQGAATCGRTGTCDGLGGCSMYAAETTVCVAPSCTGDRLNTAATCDGLGSCGATHLQDCAPYRCLDGACVKRCTTSADCVAGRVCQAGSCGKKKDGQPCASGSECGSNFCVDGVCCADACQGSCRSCNLPSSLGQCAWIPAGGDDPRGSCTPEDPATCGRDGKCDGAGMCRKHRVGTVCAPERCEGNVFTPEAACDATGKCVAPDALACAPFACNGARCYTACTVDANCVPGNFCSANSCGLKPIGAFCSNPSECASGSCAQGVCCATACASACKSCALSGSMGICSNVPTNAPDPTETCRDQGATSCGTTGLCEGGSCQRFARGTPCGGGACATNGPTLSPAAACDGAGACVTPPAISCFPFGCSGAMCRSACTSDADCAPPASCSGSSCGLKPPGAICGGGTECASGVCAQGVCCQTECAGRCMSCAVAGKAGTCSPVPAGASDPATTCANSGAASCGTTGFCDGAGACQLYAAGVQCAPPGCPVGGTTATLARSCDGAGTCLPAVSQSCGSYACNGTTCNAACGSDADCSNGTVCQDGACGKRRLGQLCSTGAACDSGNCVDGVCCASPSCGNCQSCNVPGSAGSCHAVAAGTVEPHGGCTPAPPCGWTGRCDGLGACANAPLSTSCGTASCVGGTFTPVGSCDGAGACTQVPTSCAPYLCGKDACLTSCSGDTQCAPGFTCPAGSCTDLATNSLACVSGADCISTHCVDGVCCASPSCGSCRTCARPGMAGTCAPVPVGAADPAAVCLDMGAQTCGTTGRCDGAGRCALYTAGTTCAPTGCPAGGSAVTMSTCDGAGRCQSTTVTNCAPFACNAATNACRTTCQGGEECATGYVCNAMGGGKTCRLPGGG